MDWKAIIGGIAPTIATALGGPLAGLAVEGLGKAFGMDQPTVKKVQAAITQGQLTGEQIAQIKAAEIALQVRMTELDITEDQLYAADRDSARKMQIGAPSAWPGVLSAITTTAVLGVIAARMSGMALPQDPTTIQLIGSLTTGWGMCLAYWFGTTRGSSEKSVLLAKAGTSDK
jgi:hypothetical protein